MVDFLEIWTDYGVPVAKENKKLTIKDFKMYFRPGDWYTKYDRRDTSGNALLGLIAGHCNSNKGNF